MGRISRRDTDLDVGQFDFTYDYDGRLIGADNYNGTQEALDHTFTYDPFGNMRSNSLVGIYTYPHPNSPRPHTPTDVDGETFTYDANGNMLTGLNGKVMTYDGENRPLTVTNAAGTTSYEYAPDGTRLKKIDPNGDVTLYLQYAEIRHWGDVGNEYVLAYPFDFMRYVEGEGVSFLHRDQLNSVRAITNAAGDRAKRTAYMPFGEGMDYNVDPAVSFETKGFIGERYDEDAVLQYLNARTYHASLVGFGVEIMCLVARRC